MHRLSVTLLTVCLTGLYAAPVCAETLHYFGGQTVFVAITPPAECEKSTTRLMQKSWILSAVAGDTVASDCQKSVSIILPPVNRVTRFFLSTSAISKEKTVTIDEPELILYPQNLLESVRVWATANVLYTEDSSEVLNEFLDSQKIPYIARRPEGGNDKTIKLFAGKAEIDFTEKKSDFPKIIVTDRKVTVDMPFLYNLTGNPETQKEFLNIFQQLEK